MRAMLAVGFYPRAQKIIYMYMDTMKDVKIQSITVFAFAMVMDIRHVI